MRKILIAALLSIGIAGNIAAAKDPCLTDSNADACGVAEIKLPFFQHGLFPGRQLPLPAIGAPSRSTFSAAGIFQRAASRSKPQEPALALPPRRPREEKKTEIAFFYTYDCPHCRKAIKWLSTLNTAYPGLGVHKYEVKREEKNRALFAQYLAEHKAAPSGFPTFFIGEEIIVGFAENRTPAEIITALDALAGNPGCPCDDKKEITVPLLGSIDPSSVSMLQFSLVLGLLDGLNPCAMWVLMFLMGLLVYTQSARKMLLIGGIFVTASAVVYFAFMAAWFNLFLIIGHGRWITITLGVVAAGMGLVNIKEVFFFKQGVSLMITDSAKYKLAGKIRRIINEKESAVMITATILLAIFVNLIELGCTIGLPAIFTRVLSAKQAGFWQKYGYMAVYNAAYVIPLVVIVSLFVFTMGRYKMTEIHGKVLKGISGVLMFILGLLMIFSPEALLLN